MRGQANLVALAVSLLVLTTTIGFSLVVVDGAYRSADREPNERRIADALAERLVSDSLLTTRANVINATRATTVTPARLTRAYPVTRGVDIRIRLGDETIVERGDPTGGITIRRVVLVEKRRSVTVPLRNGTLTLPNRSRRATITLAPGATTTTVRVNDRVVRYNPSGLRGTYEIDLSRYETTTIRLKPVGSATVTYYPARTRPELLVVTVDA